MSDNDPRAFMAGFAPLVLTAALLPSGLDDPRPALVEAQLDGRPEAALGIAEEFLAEHPQAGRSLGLHFLRAQLLTHLQRERDAREALTHSLASDSTIEPWVRLTLSQKEFADGHPEVASGLVATLLGRQPPDSLVEPAARLLSESLAAGGDCRLLRGLLIDPLPEPARRRLQLARLTCGLRGGQPRSALVDAAELMRERRDDLTALSAAQGMSAELTADRASPELAALVGLTLYEHRDFDRARRWLDRALTAPEMDDEQRRELLYARARTDFWRADYARAAQGFHSIADESRPTLWRARSLYQAGRSLELAGDWSRAALTFRRAYAADPDGRYAAPALLSSIRVEWRTGREGVALAALGALAENPRWAEMHHQAAIFLAATDLVRGRTDRAGAWLSAALPHDTDSRIELAYWRGRLAELQGEPEIAVRHYAEVFLRASLHPLALSASQRLRDPELLSLARSLGRQRAGRDGLGDLRTAWLLLDTEEAVAEQLLARARRNASVDRVLSAEPVPVREWPFWRESRSSAGELLLGLGLFDLATGAIQEHFPLAEPDLAVTGIDLLERAGAWRVAVRRAETLVDRVPDALPEALLPARLGRHLFPRPWSRLLEQEAEQHDVSQHLLAAIVREESRFDPDAVSPAGAHGLTQFTLPTAHRLASAAGLDSVSASDLHRPQVALALGAAYLAALGRRYAGHPLAVVAAYNAGEDQAELWRAYCVSFDPAEYYSKVGFPETRGYLRRVVRSRERYEQLYENAE